MALVGRAEESLIGAVCSKEALDKLCSQLTDLINAKDFVKAKKCVEVLVKLKKPDGKFRIQFVKPSDKAQNPDSLMTLTINIEFQSTKEPLRVFLEVNEMATFTDLQQLVEEKFRIPCATQNWIVGDKLVSSGSLVKRLADYGIKKDSKEPPLYLYVVHPKKACVSREELMRVGIAHPLAVQSDSSQAREGTAATANRQYHGNQFQPTGKLEGGAHGSTMGGVAQPLPDNKMHATPVFQQHGIPLEAFLPPGKAQAPLPPPPPPKPVGWECPACTYVNKPARPGCEQCGTPRPDDYKVPNDASLDDREKRDAELLKQFFDREREAELKQREQNWAALLKADDTPLNTNARAFECMICMTEIPAGEGVVLRGCLHECCKDCLRAHITTTTEAEVMCPFKDAEFSCDCPISDIEIRALLNEQEIENVHLRSLRQAENADLHSFHCRTPNCKGFCFYDDDVNEFTCEVCNKKNCILCKAIHEGMNCQQYQDDLKRRAANDEAAKATQEMMEAMIRDGEAMNCPKCKIVIQKKDGCDWIKCMMCKTEICWVTRGPRWGPKGEGDTSGGCGCALWQGGKACHPQCKCCH